MKREKVCVPPTSAMQLDQSANAALHAPYRSADGFGNPGGVIEFTQPRSADAFTRLDRRGMEVAVAAFGQTVSRRLGIEIDVEILQIGGDFCSAGLLASQLALTYAPDH